MKEVTNINVLSVGRKGICGGMDSFGLLMCFLCCLLCHFLGCPKGFLLELTLLATAFGLIWLAPVCTRERRSLEIL